MKIIGITGPSGSGKSEVAKILRDKKIAVLDADEIYHSLLVPPSECLDAIRKSFGDDIFDADGVLIRSELAKIVFTDKEKLALLNSITHTFVTDKMRAMLREFESRGDEAVALDVPLLFEAEVDKLFSTNLNIAVLAERTVRVSRISARDNISEAAALERISAQPDDDFYVVRADKVIYNDGCEAELEGQILQILKEL